MARSLGIHLQSHGFDFALLEGSAKKYSVTKSGSAVFRSEDLRSTKRLGKLIADTCKAGKVDQVIVTLPASGVVMRELSMPFNDREKVMQVLKFEVESELYHLDIDDVIADFIELNDGRATPTLLVSVLEKERIASSLEVLDHADCDPPVVTLSHGSLLAALNELPHEGAEGSEGREAYLHIGAESSLMMVLNGDGSLYGVRALPLGWLELARGLNIEDAEMALPESSSDEENANEDSGSEETPADSIEEGADAGEESASEEDSEEEDEDDHEVTIGGDSSLPFGISFETALELADDAAQQGFMARFASEVRRGLAAMGIPSGGSLYMLGARIPGLEGYLEARLGKDIAPLDLGQVDKNDNVPEPIAFGAGLRGLGVDVSPMNFRQEEFRYARGLERVEGPLTLALVGLIVFFAIEFVLNFKVIQQRQADANALYVKAHNKVEQINKRVQDDEEYPIEWIVKSDFAGMGIADEERIIRLGNNVRKGKTQLDELMGASALEMPSSCLEAWRLLMTFLEDEMASFNGRWMIESFEFSSVEASSRQPAHVDAKFGITIFPDGSGDFIGRFDQIPSALNRQDWTVGEALIPSTESVGTEGAKSGVVKVKILTNSPAITPGAGK
ncbi:MAG: pilus assembly protein PilM [Planctomycetes bacterium]|nr:pilus assembly protein PilM [Planctomycetota bacterium]MCP4770397.1 pilus assembly protein PilM [Planctomycetota bacterium]MCP4860511.1 pilus assembly protein PilM [Planctomycetota bacterium]